MLNKLISKIKYKLKIGNNLYEKPNLFDRAYNIGQADGSTIKLSKGVRTYLSIEGKLHRNDGPAEEWWGGTQKWYQHGMLHREDGPAYISGPIKYWYKHDLLHREDGPAIESPTQDAWLLNNKLHRLDGPAHIEYLFGRVFVKRYFIYGNFIDVTSDKEFQKYIKLKAFL